LHWQRDEYNAKAVPLPAGSIDVQHEELARACGIDVSNIKVGLRFPLLC
jgi:hypothetical protein